MKQCYSWIDSHTRLLASKRHALKQLRDPLPESHYGQTPLKSLILALSAHACWGVRRELSKRSPDVSQIYQST